MPTVIKPGNKEHPSQPEEGRIFACSLCGTQMQVGAFEPQSKPAVIPGRHFSEDRTGWTLPCCGCGQEVFIGKFPEK